MSELALTAYLLMGALMGSVFGTWVVGEDDPSPNTSRALFVAAFMGLWPLAAAGISVFLLTMLMHRLNVKVLKRLGYAQVPRNG